jgi:hypothetical protein
VQQVKGDGSKGVKLPTKRGLEEALLEVDGVKKVKVAGVVEMDQGDLVLTAGQRTGPAGHNEAYCLELSGSGQPPGS